MCFPPFKQQNSLPYSTINEKKAKEQGVEQDFSFKITFAWEEQLKRKKLKLAINDYQNLVPGTTKRRKPKTGEDEDVKSNTDLDDGFKQFKIGFKIYKLFDGVAHIGTVIGYNPRERMYHITYKDGDEEHIFHNKVHSYKDKIEPREIKKKPKPTTSEPFKARKKKDIRRKNRTQNWRRKSKEANLVATNQVLNLL